MKPFKSYLEDMSEGTHGPEGMGHPYSDYADKHAKKKIRLSKHIDKDAHDAGIAEEAPVNSTGPAVDMNQNGKPKKLDRRSRFDVMKMYRRALGQK